MKNIIESLRSTLLEANSSYRIVESCNGGRSESFQTALFSLCESINNARMLLSKITGYGEEELTECTLKCVANPSKLDVWINA